MMKPVTIALVLAIGVGQAHAEPLDGKPVPLFPKLTWGLSRQAAVSKGLTTYTNQTTKADVVGLPTMKIGDIDFSVRAAFGKNDIGGVRSGLNYIVLQHEGFVPRGQYEKLIRLITSGFLYAGRGSVVNESSVFYNSVDRENNLVVTTSDGAKVYTSVAIAPGVSK